MRLFWAIAIVGTSLLCPATVQAEKRVALVIGNAAYRNMPQLMNPRNDAADVGAKLRQLGFETTVATDLDRIGFNDALARFSGATEGADIALVYYSGHGMQFAGTNYLLPIDAALDEATNINRFRLTPVDDVLETLKLAPGARVLVLDACRNNPAEAEMKRKSNIKDNNDRGIANPEPIQRAVDLAKRGLARKADGDNDTAISDYSEAIRINPNARFFTFRGDAWLAKGDRDRAMADYNEAIRLDPKSAYQLTRRGDAWKAMGESHLAFADYDKAIRIDPKYAVALSSRGDAWLAKGDRDRAMADYNEAIRLGRSRARHG